MSTALVGSTGFVGGNLLRDRVFDVAVSSRTAGELRGGEFEHVVFTAAKAEKWRANADPSADRRHIADLERLLESFSTERLTLISTVDVHPDPAGVDERSEIDITRCHQYGRGRYELEIAAARVHPRIAVLRLPALFGPGLKKNVVFDLLHHNQLERVQPRSEFQYYDLRRLADDIDRAWTAGLGLAHLVAQPVSTADVLAHAFHRAPLPDRADLPVVRYDVQTVHAEVFGGSGRYIAGRRRVLDGLESFVRGAVSEEAR